MRVFSNNQRSKGQVEDFIKLAAGVVVGIFVLFIAYLFITNYLSTECWRQALKPFDEAMLISGSLQPKLGSSELFKVAVDFGASTCLRAAYFASDRFGCSEACAKSGLSSGVVTDCQQSCAQRCSSGCIVLNPTGEYIKDIFRGQFGYNKPRVYGDGQYRLEFRWDAGPGGYKPVDKDSRAQGKEVKCLVFSRLAGGNAYSVEPAGQDRCA